MNSIIISLIPTIAMLLLGASLWYTDPWVRAQRARARSSQCVGCGATHHRTNECDGSFSAFCSADCHEATMS